MGFTCRYFYIQGLQLATWRCLYPGVDIDGELEKMVEWLDANPRRHKRNYRRFAVGWLNKAHGNLLAAEVTALVKREQERVDAEVGKLRQV
jgi:hypothetical protein